MAQASRCSADARPGTEAPSLRAWLAVLEGDPGCQPFLSPYLEQLSGSCWAPASSSSPAGLSDLMPMRCCRLRRRCPKTEGRCPDQKESLGHGNPDNPQPLSQFHILMCSSLVHLPWDSTRHHPHKRRKITSISSLARDPTANQFAQNPQPKRQLWLTKQQLELQGPLDFGPQFVNSWAILPRKFLGSKWLLPRPRTGKEESGGPLLITVRTAQG